jgi:hypothetical protein
MDALVKRLRTALALTLTLASGVAQAALLGRDLNNTPTTAEAYYDTVLGITWLADANYFQTSGADTDGLASFSTLSNWASNLVIGSYVNWRLPEAAPADGVAYDIGSITYDGVSSDVGWNHSGAGNELGYMFYVNLGNQGAYDTTGATTACHPNTCLTNTGPFVDLMPGEYYIMQGSYWVPYFRMYDGGYFAHANGGPEKRGWIVHDGDIGGAVVVVPEPQTWALLLAGLGLVGGWVRRRH